MIEIALPAWLWPILAVWLVLDMVKTALELLLRWKRRRARKRGQG